MTPYIRPKCVKTLSLVSAGLTVAYTVLCLLSVILYKPVCRLFMAPAELTQNTLPSSVTTIMMISSMRTLLFAIPAFMNVYQDDGGRYAFTKLIVSAIYVPISSGADFLTKLLLTTMLNAAGGVQSIAVYSAVSSFQGFFSILNIGAVIILFSALAIELYEYTRHTRIQGTQALDIQP